MGPTIKGGFLPNRGAYQLREVSYLIRGAYQLKEVSYLIREAY